MKRKLLCILAVGFSISSLMATAPNNPNGVSKVNKMQRASSMRADAEYSLQSYNLNPNATEASVAMPIGPLTYVNVGSSPNLFTAIVSQSHCLTANQDLNTVLFTHRRNVTTAGNSGFVQTSFSTNGGSSFDTVLTVVGDATDAHLCRYPNGALLNPAGNTNPLNAFAVVSGPWHPGAGWQGNFFGTRQLSGANANAVFVDNLNLGGAQKSDFARITAQATDDGKFHVMGADYTNANGTDAPSQGFKKAVMHTGTLNTVNNSFSWSTKTFPHTFRKDPTDGSFNVFTTSLNAWSQDGNVGYVIYIGQDSASYATLRSFQPIVYKTINGGTTWNFMPMFDFSTLTNLTSSLRATSAGTKRPFFTQASGMGVTVDANYNLHIVSSVSSASSNDIDSLDFTWNLPKIIADVYTTPNGWEAQVIDSLMTEEVADADSPWQASDGSGGNGWDARIQISRSQDGKRIFYGWMDTDASWAVQTNQFPDFYAKGYNVETGYLTPTLNFTSSDVATHGKIQWMFMQNISLKNNTTYDLGFTTSTSYDGSFDALSGVKHFYVKGAKFNDGEFTVPGNITCSPYTATVTASEDTCSSASATATAIISNSTAPSFSYSWNGGASSTSSMGTGLHTGANYLSVIDNNGCITTTQFSISDFGSATSVNSTPTATSNCNTQDGSATVVGFPSNPNFNYTYSWNSNPPQSGAFADSLGAQVYQVTITNILSPSQTCISTFNVTIPAGGLPTVTTTPTNVLCNGGTNGSATATAIGGTAPFTYAWSTSPVQTLATATNLAPGTYNVTLTDANLCSTTSTVSVAQPEAISVTPVTVLFPTTVTSTDGSLAVTATGGSAPFTYSWNSIPVQISATATGLVSGVYIVTVTDANACSVAYDISIDVTGLDKVELNNLVRFYPNPTNGIVNFTVAKDFGTALNLVVMSIDGSVIMNKNYTSNSVKTIDLTNVANGIYFVKVSVGNKFGTMKITKM